MISRSFGEGFELASTYNAPVVRGYYAGVLSKFGVGLQWTERKKLCQKIQLE